MGGCTMVSMVLTGRKAERTRSLLFLGHITFRLLWQSLQPSVVCYLQLFLLAVQLLLFIWNTTYHRIETVHGLCIILMTVKSSFLSAAMNHGLSWLLLDLPPHTHTHKEMYFTLWEIHKTCSSHSKEKSMYSECRVGYFWLLIYSLSQPCSPTDVTMAP